MVDLAVYILRYIYGLGVRFKGLHSQVKGDVEKVDTFFIWFDCKLKVVLAKCAAYFLLDGLNFSRWEVKCSQTIVSLKANFRSVTRKYSLESKKTLAQAFALPARIEIRFK